MCELIINVLGTIIGGLLFTLILFILNEFIFPNKNLTGEWVVTLKINNTKYIPYTDLGIEYKIHLLQKEYELTGSGEKIKDIKPDGTFTVFEHEKRVNVVVDGFFERKYLGTSKVYLNISEAGRLRNTRSTYILTLKKNNILEGTFVSTAADTRGIIYMIKP